MRDDNGAPIVDDYAALGIVSLNGATKLERGSDTLTWPG